MKPIRGLAEAPAGLDDFVHQFPEERDWEAFKNHNGGSSCKELLKILVDVQHGLCCYCEIDLRELDWQVEHFHPKRDRTADLNHTTTYGNLMAACCGGGRIDIWGDRNPRADARDPMRHRDPTRDNLSCGQAKDHHERHTPGTTVIDPRGLPTAASIMRVALDGRLEPDETACAAAGFDPAHVRDTIRLLGLNCERLRVSRADRLQNLGAMFNDMDAEVLIAAARRDLLPDQEGRLPRFFTTTRSFFREAAERVLADEPQAWI